MSCRNPSRSARAAPLKVSCGMPCAAVDDGALQNRPPSRAGVRGAPERRLPRVRPLFYSDTRFLSYQSLS